MRRTRTCPCDALPTVTLIRIRFRRLALDTFNMELRDIQADRDKHLREHEAATQALLEERRKLNMEREAAMADQAAKERELTDVAREQAEKAGQLASEQSAMSYERKMLDRERGELERELETLVRPTHRNSPFATLAGAGSSSHACGQEKEKAQQTADRAQIEAYSAKLNELGRQLQEKSSDLATSRADAERQVRRVCNRWKLHS